VVSELGGVMGAAQRLGSCLAFGVHRHTMMLMIGILHVALAIRETRHTFCTTGFIGFFSTLYFAYFESFAWIRFFGGQEALS